MSTIKSFMVSAYNGEVQVLLEVDLAKLTPALAKLVNNFWGNGDHRVTEADGDVVKAVIRLYGVSLIGEMLERGGCFFDLAAFPEMAERWTRLMQTQEGWPGPDGTPYGAVGIRVVSAVVEVPGFDDCELSEGRRA